MNSGQFKDRTKPKRGLNDARARMIFGVGESDGCEDCETTRPWKFVTPGCEL
jgi:hypothetical protein